MRRTYVEQTLLDYYIIQTQWTEEVEEEGGLPCEKFTVD